MTDRRSLEAFNRSLDSLISGDEQPGGPPLEALNEADHQALEIAARLAALNPSLETRSRYPIRRSLLAQSSEQTGPSWKASALRLTPGLALLMVLMCLFVGTAAGLNVSPTQAATLSADQAAALQPVLASAPALAGAPAPQISPLRAPTPQAHPDSTTVSPQAETKQLTPGRSTPPGVINIQHTGVNAADH